jgi:hypothetical protein
MKKGFLLVVCCAAAVFCGTAFTGRSKGIVAAPQHSNASKPPGHIPEHVSYGFLFLTVTNFRSKAAERGRPHAPNSVLTKEAALSEAHARALEAVAAATVAEVEQQDARAREVIKAFRARYPGGVVPRGERLPPPPSELKTMQEERNAIILRGRDRVRAAFGEREYARFNEFVLKRFAAKGVGEEQQ